MGNLSRLTTPITRPPEAVSSLDADWPRRLGGKAKFEFHWLREAEAANQRRGRWCRETGLPFSDRFARFLSTKAQIEKEMQLQNLLLCTVEDVLIVSSGI